MNKVFLYNHGGAKNHGCEALVRTTIKVLGGADTLYSQRPHEDAAYGLDKLINVKLEGRVYKKYRFNHFRLKLQSMIAGNINGYGRFMYRNILNDAACGDVYLSIGGDNYCCGSFYKNLAFLNEALSRNNKTVLWGCSIEPELLKNPEICGDLKRYALITARESITYNALIDAGIDKNTHLIPDTAFTLDAENSKLPVEFVENNTIGINLSPLIIGCESRAGVTMDNFKGLIRHILDTTDMHIALIPHVVWDFNDDRQPLGELYREFESTGRVALIGDCSCMELKGVIGRCRMFIGARTHSTIAAYSSCVPTLVVGYSVKSRGIAKDIFGTHENYVVPVQTLQSSDDLIRAFEWMRQHEQDMRGHLQGFMPEYCQRAFDAAGQIKKLMGE
ncbi:MAG: polysaccharide pyruvyl transferase family protein [Oscillospiraceae bacterium]|nr:polysaccharide pyruvyl transferase family protein [Oscillospiraceae bacterium]